MHSARNEPLGVSLRGADTEPHLLAGTREIEAQGISVGDPWSPAQCRSGLRLTLAT